MFNSTRIAAILGQAEKLSTQLIKTPRVIGKRRASLLLAWAREGNPAGRTALQQCAKAAGRHQCLPFPGEPGTQRDRVFNKASTLRLSNWAQGRNSPH